MTDRIEKSIEIQAPVARVWQALTDHRQFGEWFRVQLEGPFVPGKTVRGRITHPGFEHVQFEAMVKEMEPERRFAFDWHPFAVDPKRDYSQETPTSVVITLEPVAGGTVVRAVETGFDRIPEDRRAEAFRMNTGGWEGQLRNIEAYVTRN